MSPTARTSRTEGITTPVGTTTVGTPATAETWAKGGTPATVL